MVMVMRKKMCTRLLVLLFTKYVESVENGSTVGILCIKMAKFGLLDIF